jgi:putative ABC transport system ATP-binding protein
VIGLLDRPTDGEYLIDGRGTTSLGDDELAHVRARKVGFIFQSFHLVPRLTAFENVELPMVLAAIAPAERRERTQAVLAAEFTDRAHHRDQPRRAAAWPSHGDGHAADCAAC